MDVKEDQIFDCQILLPNVVVVVVAAVIVIVIVPDLLSRLITLP